MSDILLVTSEGTYPVPPADRMIPHAATFLSLYTGGSARVYWPSDSALRHARENAVKMRVDASVMECVELRQRTTAMLNWSIQTTRAEYEEYRQELEEIIRSIPRFLQYRENLLHAIWYGRYAISNKYEWRLINGKPRVCVVGWQPIHGDKLVWKVNSDTYDFLDGLGIRVGGVQSSLAHQVKEWHEFWKPYIESTEYGWAFFPPDWIKETLVVHRHYIEDGEYETPINASRIYGVGIRDRIYWTWYQKQEALAWLMEFLERSALGVELWFYPAGNEQAREETRTAASRRVGPNKNILLVPRYPGEGKDSYGVQRIEPSMEGAKAILDVIVNYFSHTIKRYILGQTLTTEAHATGLGSNLASVHLGTCMAIINYDAANLEETLTEQLVRRLVRWNWPDIDANCFRFAIEPYRADTLERLQAVKIAHDIGVRVREQDIHDLLGLSPPAEGEAVV